MGEMKENQGVAASQSGVPNARRMRMEWSTDAGVVVFEFPSNLSCDDVGDVGELLDLALSGMSRRAQGGVTRTGGDSSEAPVSEAN